MRFKNKAAIAGDNCNIIMDLLIHCARILAGIYPE
jgi:hypothetical protein